MLKIIKEIIIMLLVCLVAILLLAVLFYEYIPARKVVAEVTTYTASDTVSELLADDIDKKDVDVILTFEEGEYEVTSSDLNNYEATNNYVPGKANPFAAVSTEETNEGTDKTDDNSSTNKDDKDNEDTDNEDSKTTDNSDKETSYINDKGMK